MAIHCRAVKNSLCGTTRNSKSKAERTTAATGSAVAQERSGISGDVNNSRVAKTNGNGLITTGTFATAGTPTTAGTLARAGTPETSETLAAERASSVVRMKEQRDSSHSKDSRDINSNKNKSSRTDSNTRELEHSRTPELVETPVERILIAGTPSTMDYRNLSEVPSSGNELESSSLKLKSSKK
jgi:hypothetical protein